MPALPAARYYVQRRNLENARHPNPRERASYLAENFEPLDEAGVLETCTTGRRCRGPGFELFTADGHTRGQQLVRVSGAEGVLYFVADLIPTAAHVRIPFVMGYDVAAIETMDGEARAARARGERERRGSASSTTRRSRWAARAADGDDFAWAETLPAAGAAARPAPRRIRPSAADACSTPCSACGSSSA